MAFNFFPEFKNSYPAMKIIVPTTHFSQELCIWIENEGFINAIAPILTLSLEGDLRHYKSGFERKEHFLP